MKRGGKFIELLNKAVAGGAVLLAIGALVACESSQADRNLITENVALAKVLTEVETLRGEVKQRDQTLTMLQAELDRAKQQQVAPVPENVTPPSESQRERDLSTENVGLQKRLAEMDALRDQLKQRDGAINALEADFKKAKQQVSSASKKQDDLRAQVKAAIVQVKRLKSEVVTLKKQLVALKQNPSHTKQSLATAKPGAKPASKEQAMPQPQAEKQAKIAAAERSR